MNIPFLPNKKKCALTPTITNELKVLSCLQFWCPVTQNLHQVIPCFLSSSCLNQPCLTMFPIQPMVLLISQPWVCLDLHLALNPIMNVAPTWLMPSVHSRLAPIPLPQWVMFPVLRHRVHTAVYQVMVKLCSGAQMNCTYNFIDNFSRNSATCIQPTWRKCRFGGSHGHYSWAYGWFSSSCLSRTGVLV